MEVPFATLEATQKELAISATRILMQWQALAKSWDVYTEGDYMRCGCCHQAMYRIIDASGIPYRWSDDERLSMKVAHLRQRHSEKGIEFV